MGEPNCFSKKSFQKKYLNIGNGIFSRHQKRIPCKQVANWFVRIPLTALKEAIDHATSILEGCFKNLPLCLIGGREPKFVYQNSKYH